MTAFLITLATDVNDLLAYSFSLHICRQEKTTVDSS